MLPKTLSTIKSYTFDSTAIKFIFQLRTTQITSKNKYLVNEHQKQRKYDVQEKMNEEKQVCVEIEK